MADASLVRSAIDGILAGMADKRGALLPLLHGLQREFGYIPAGAVPQIADALNLSRAEVHGVLSFYHDFRDRPPARHMVKLCRAESCQARGADAIARALVERLEVELGEERADGAVAIEAVYCLGLCAIGPNAMVDDRPVARLDIAAVERIAEAVAA